MLFSVLIVLSLFSLIGFSGYVLLRTITGEHRFLILIASSIFLGLSLYIFLLNLNSKFLHGPSGIILSTTELVLFDIYILLRYRKSWINLKSFRQDRLIKWFLLISFFALVTLRVVTLFPAADSTMQWAYAASFARGNYPPMMPWQPDLPPNYHLGAYFFEGALHFFSGLSFTPIHSLVDIFFIVPLILLSVLLLWKSKNSLKNIWLVLAGFVLFISFGVIILASPSFLNEQPFTTDLVNLDQIISLIPAKGQAGAPLVNLHILTLLPARSLALGLIFLVLYFTKASFKNNKIKLALVVLIFSITALVEETLFLPMFLTAIVVLFLSFFFFIPNIKAFNIPRKSLLIIIILTSIMIVLQGGFITDNLFTRKESAYRIIIPFLNPLFLDSVSIFKNTSVNLIISPSYNINLLIPSPIWIVVALLIYSVLKKDPTTGLIGIFSGLSFFLSVTAQYIYCVYCSQRIYSHGNMAAGYGLIIMLFLAFNKLSVKKNLLVFLALIPVLIIPTILPDLLQQIKSVAEGLREKKAVVIFSPIPRSNDLFPKWASKNLPLNSRIIVVDTEFPYPSRFLDFQYRGIYTVYSPQYIRSNRQEPGIEYFDLSLTLNPSLFRKTKTEYLYIESSSQAYKQLPDFRKADLENSKYFEVLLSYDTVDAKGNQEFYRIYRVLSPYLDALNGGREITENTLSKLQSLLPNHKSIYISDYGIQKLNFWYRMALVLSIKDKNIWRDLSQTEYQLIETFLTRQNVIPGKDYDFYILPPNEKPTTPAELIWSNIFASAWKKI